MQFCPSTHLQHLNACHVHGHMVLGSTLGKQPFATGCAPQLRQKALHACQSAFGARLTRLSSPYHMHTAVEQARRGSSTYCTRATPYK